MKRLALCSLTALVLVGCGSTEPYQKRADDERQRQEKYTERAIDKAPKWMTELPKSNSAVYANGTATSSDFTMADNKAKVMAYGKICMAAGGEVDQRSTVYRNDMNDASVESSEMAIRSLCQRVDISGVETVEVKRIAEGTRFRSYVLVALPTGDANAIVKRKDNLRAQERAEQRSGEVFREMDKR
jgi:hypothetical protein